MISILVVSYNSRDHLRHCLEQLVRLDPLTGQRGDEHETIVIDNASTDGSDTMVEKEFPHCRLLRLEENLGFGAANNRGARVASGDHLLLLNSDAWLAEGALEHLVEVLTADPRLAMVAPDLRYPDGSRQFAWAPETGVLGEALQMLRNRFEARAWAHRLPPRWLRPLLGPGWLSGACVLVRHEAFRDVGGFDEDIFMYFEDVDLSRRLRQAGWRLGVATEARALHVKGGSRPSGRGEIEYRRAQLYYYRKHRPAWENRFLRWKMRRKFARVREAGLRRDLLLLLGPGA
ncbi:MAG: glycosyltransferase family 2 protein [Acidobacteriota bacterium]